MGFKISVEDIKEFLETTEVIWRGLDARGEVVSNNKLNNSVNKETGNYELLLALREKGCGLIKSSDVIISPVNFIVVGGNTEWNITPRDMSIIWTKFLLNKYPEKSNTISKLLQEKKNKVEDEILKKIQKLEKTKKYFEEKLVDELAGIDGLQNEIQLEDAKKDAIKVKKIEQTKQYFERKKNRQVAEIESVQEEIELKNNEEFNN